MDGQIWPVLLKVRVESLRDAFAELEDELDSLNSPGAKDVRIEARVHKEELEVLRDILLHTDVEAQPSTVKHVSDHLSLLKDHYHRITRRWVRLVCTSERVKRKMAA